MQCILAILLVTIPIIAFAEAPLPDLGDPTSTVISPYAEHKIGRGVYQQLQAYGLIDPDPIANDYIQNLGDTLVGLQQEGPYHYTFFIVDDPSVNAFAFPGGYVGVHRGLINKTRSEDELAAVMAHEIAHVKQRHLVRFYAYQSQTNIASIVGVLTAALLMPQHDQLGQGLLIASLAGQNQTLINFTRYQEQEADQIGMRLLADGGFDPQAMPAFFKTLEQYGRINGHGEGVEYLQTHPLTENRIAQAQQQAAKFKVHTPIHSNLSYQLIKARLSLRNTTDLKKALPQLRAQYQAQPEALLSSYTYAYALLAQGDAAKALAVIRTVHPPADVAALVRFMELEAKFALGMEGVLAELKDLYASYPKYHALGCFYAAALAQDNPRQASFILEQLRAQTPEDVEVHRLRSIVYATLQRPFEAYLARADYHFYRGERSEAQLALALARKMAAPDSIEMVQVEEKSALFE